MTDNADPDSFGQIDPPGQTGVGWQVACGLVILLGPLTGLIYLHYRPDWSGLAEPFVVSRADTLWILGAAALLALLALFWIINRQTRRRSDFHRHRAQQAESAVGRLLEEIRTTCGDAHVEHPSTQWLAGNDAQTAEINRIAREIASMADAIRRIDESASKSAERARHSATTAQEGAAAAQNAVAGMNDTRHRIQEAADRLKQLAQSTRQFNETAHLIRDVTEQASVLSLNASIRSGVAGHAEADAAAEEMRCLADRSARAAGDIAELVRAVQSDADGIIASLEGIADNAAGVAPAGDAGRALAEIESASRELREWMTQVVSGAADAVAHAQTVGEKIEQLRAAAGQSGANASRVVDDIEKLQAAAGRERSASGPPER